MHEQGKRKERQALSLARRKSAAADLIEAANARCWARSAPILSSSPLALTLRGVGIGLSFIPVMTVAYASLRTDQLSDATPQMNVLQRLVF